MAVDFVHLHTHSQFSLLDGFCSIEGMVQKARELHMPALALTDHGAMHGTVPFYKHAMAAGIKPIIGCEVYVAQGSRFDKNKRDSERPFHLTLLAENDAGYRHLMKLSSQGYLEGFYYKPRIDKELLARHAAGLICLSGCLAGEVPSLILAGRLDAAVETALWYRDVFGGERYFLELQANGLGAQDRVNDGLLALHRRTGIPIVATNDVHYVERADAEAHDVVLCIQTGKQVSDADRLRFHSDQYYMKSSAEMAAAFSEHPEALSNTLRVAERCRVSLDMNSVHLPNFTPPGGMAAAGYLRQLAQDGAVARFGRVDQRYQRRLKHELQIIEQMGYPAYFLIVADLIDFARRRGIPVGPGRGSAASSLVAYCLGITDVDPLRYGLVFERFLNPERVTMPDIDIDFCYERRGKIIQYVTDRYGLDRVAQIATFGTLAARAAIRDVGRVLGIAYGEVDRLAKLIPSEIGMTLAGAMEKVPALKDAYRSDSSVASLVEMAMAVEGTPRHMSTHAAGVVITGDPLTDHVPLAVTQDGTVVTQYPMEDLETIGLLKMDFLGLRTLTVIDRSLRLIEAGRGIVLDINEIPLDDDAVYKMLAEGSSSGVFQLETPMFHRLLQVVRPSEFEDIVAIVALGRPGPMVRLDDFVRRKHGEEPIRYLHPDLEPILSDTYGVMVYQEQVMRIASELAGYSPGEADLLRRGMGKKKQEIIDAERGRFVQGAVARGVAQAVAEEIFAEMARFAQYGFAKAHSVPYALIAYRTAYLRAHFPVEFMAAQLSSVASSTDKVAAYVRECKQMGIEVHPPHVNASGIDFGVDDGGIRFSLSAVKHVGRSAAEAIRTEAQAQPFASLWDFCRRIDTDDVPKKAVESLIKSGAFDWSGKPRAQLLAGLDLYLDRGQRLRYETAGGQTSFADLMGSDTAHFVDEEPGLPDVPPASAYRRLLWEKEATGLFVTGHPLDAWKSELERWRGTQLSKLASRPDKTVVLVAGLLTDLKDVTTRSGRQMAFGTLEDYDGRIEVIIFPDIYGEAREFLQADLPFLIRGRTDLQDDGEVKVVAETMMPLSPAPLVVEVPGGKKPNLERSLQVLKDQAVDSPGQRPVCLQMTFGKKRVTILTGPAFWIDANRSVDVEGMMPS